MIRLWIAGGVATEDAKEDDILVGAYDEDANEEANGEGCREALQNEGPQNGQHEV